MHVRLPSAPAEGPSGGAYCHTTQNNTPYVTHHSKQPPHYQLNPTISFHPLHNPYHPRNINPLSTHQIPCPTPSKTETCSSPAADGTCSNPPLPALSPQALSLTSAPSAHPRGLGALVAERFAAEGCNVAINYVSNAERAKETAGKVEGYGGRSVVVQGVCMYDERRAGVFAGWRGDLL